jgi:putative endonuclease
MQTQLLSRTPLEILYLYLMEKFYVYVLISQKDNSWYIGYTANLKERIIQHNSGKTLTTSKKMPWKILYYEVAFDKQDAIAREKYLKSGMGRRYLKNRLKNQLDF